jgi:hypothetical protein
MTTLGCLVLGSIPKTAGLGGLPKQSPIEEEFGASIIVLISIFTQNSHSEHFAVCQSEWGLRINDNGCKSMISLPFLIYVFALAT